jgi:hypothetical protein
LYSQHIANKTITEPSEIVSRMGGIQSQDERSARWSIGLRVPGSTDSEISTSINNREILRTWLFRGTLHYVAQADIFWLLKLLTPHVIKGNARRYEQLGLDEEVFKKSRAVLPQFLRKNQESDRSELKNAFNAAGISTEGQQLPYLFQRAALDGLIYISGMRGREMTFRLLSDLNLQKPDLDQNDLLAKLTERYFREHGPAKIRDFAWWSGLPINVARKGLAGCAALQEMVLGGENYWYLDGTSVKDVEHFACLLPPFDEYLLGYRDRDLVLDPAFAKQVNRGGGVLKPTLLLGGRVAGIWRKIDQRDQLQVEIQPFTPLSRTDQELIEQAAQRLGEFYGKLPKVRFSLL